MKVKYKVKAKKQWSRYLRDTVRAAVEFAIDEYDLQGYGRLTVKLNFTPGEFGSAVSLTSDEHMIFVSADKDPAMIIKTVFHELWHIRQYIYDGFELETTTAYWKGETFPFDAKGTDYDEYFNQPWEVEAREMEEKTYKAYTEY